MAEPVKHRRRRLDFLIAHLAGVTRKEAKQCIRHGRVEVDGLDRHQLRGQTGVGVDDAIYLDGERLERDSADRYFMLNKPAGVVSATRDDHDATVLDLVDPRDRRGLHPVGRLDKDTTGLMLLSTDGEWSHRVTSPRFACPKVYRVSMAEPIADETLARLERGVVLRGDSKPSHARYVQRISPTQLRLTLDQGRYHQIKRMIGAVGNRVTELHRECIGGLALDPALEEGDYRALSRDEIERVMPLGSQQAQ